MNQFYSVETNFDELWFRKQTFWGKSRITINRYWNYCRWQRETFSWPYKQDQLFWTSLADVRYFYCKKGQLKCRNDFEEVTSCYIRSFYFVKIVIFVWENSTNPGQSGTSDGTRDVIINIHFIISTNIQMDREWIDFTTLICQQRIGNDIVNKNIRKRNS